MWVGQPIVSRETGQRLRSYADLVEKWNPSINLVSRQSLLNLGERHFRDSAQLYAIPDVAVNRWVDLGSGGGFPGIVIAILATETKGRPEVILVEADGRKAAFLREVARILSLNARVIHSRIEDVKPLGADVISARALAPLSQLCAFSAVHMRPDGIGIFPKGAQYQQEFGDAQREWSFDAAIVPSVTDPEASILCLRNIRHAG